MRILAGCDWFGPGVGGGAERVAWEVYRRLAADGHQITVVATIPEHRSFPDVGPNLSVIPVPSLDLTPVLRVQLSLARGLHPAFRDAADTLRPDVVHANSLQFQTTRGATWLARDRGLPLVVTAHLADLGAFPGWVGTAATVHERFIGAPMLRGASRAIAVSDAVARHVRAIAPLVPVDVVCNGVDLGSFPPRTGERRPGPPRLGIVGRLVPNKGVTVALDAVAGLRARGVAAELWVIGDGPLRRSLEARSVALGIGPSVVFLGHREDIGDLLADLDVLLRPSYTEGMSLALLEAMSVGVPIVASDIEGNATIVTHGVTGLLAPAGDAEALARAIERLLLDPGEARRLAARASELVHEMSWEATTAGTLASLQRAADPAPVPLARDRADGSRPTHHAEAQP